MEKQKYISEVPSLMQEWDWNANANLDPTQLACSSNKKVYWICSLCGTSWQAAIYNRFKNGESCLHCHHGRWLKNKDSLAKTKPQSIIDWHQTKNGNLTPNMFTKGARYEAWWKCSECGREWKQAIKLYRGCVNCNKKHRLLKNSLANKFPQLCKEWHPTKNGKLTPNDVFCTARKVWWKCNKCGYEWEARIDNRVHNRGCPCCSNKVVITGKNDLETTHPELAKEWHKTKNGNLTPKDVTYGYGKKVWWYCPNGHEYQATVNHRTCHKGTNCPICASGTQTSFAEQAFYFYIKKLYPDAINRYRTDFLEKMELDIYIPSIKWAIEYDGEAFHKEDKLNRERKKYHLCREHGIKLIRFREKEIVLGQDISDEAYHTPDMSNPKNLEKMIIWFLQEINFDKKYAFQINPFDVDVQRDRLKILRSYATAYKEDSFGDLYPKIAKEWHLTKNEGLSPFMFKPGSDHKVWWTCPKCGYEYQASIGSRVRGTGCRKCGINRSNNAKMKPVDMIDIKNNRIIRHFSSITEASKELHISSSNISMVCKGMKPKAGGYGWRYTNEKGEKKDFKNKNQLEFDF